MAMETYRTSDLYLSAFLKAKGVRLLDKHWAGGKLTFVFEDKGDMAGIVMQFFNNGLVDITAFKNAVQDLKTMMFNA